MKKVWLDVLGRRDRPAAMSKDDERADIALEMALVLNRPVKDGPGETIIFGRESGKALDPLFVWQESGELWSP